MRKGVYILPNGLTLCGMLFGFYSILASFKGSYVEAGWAIIIASVFDGLDGWVARLTHSTTRFGIELDSLTDLIAFGVAPAVMVYSWSLKSDGRIGWAVSFPVPLLSFKQNRWKRPFSSHQLKPKRAMWSFFLMPAQASTFIAITRRGERISRPGYMH